MIWEKWKRTIIIQLKNVGNSVDKKLNNEWITQLTKK